MKEESLTDWLLDHFMQQSSEILYYQFTRHEEGKESGADWDWWILLEHGCFKIRVQAKKVRKSHDHYRDLARSNKSGYQLDMLLKSSASQNFYPIYALYGFAEGGERCEHTPRPEPLHICSAQEVYDIVFASARTRIDSSTLLGLSIPLSCLFCCPRVNDSLLSSTENIFRRHFGRSSRVCEGEEDGEALDLGSRQGFEERVPEVVRALFETQKANDNREELLKKYQGEFSGANGVLITRNPV